MKTKSPFKRHFNRHHHHPVLYHLILVNILSYFYGHNCAPDNLIPQTNPDLCYLTDGGSSQTFTVNEATPINSVIGTLQVSPRLFDSSA